MNRIHADANTLINRSISHSETVHGLNVNTVHADLMAECEDWTSANGEVEFWGTDENGNDWRVHLDA